MKPANSEKVLETASLALNLGIPLIQRVSVVRCHSAARITWHSHPYYEVLMLSEGATAYEFKDGVTAELTGGQFLVIPPNAIHRGVNDVRRPANLCGVMIAPQLAESTQHTPFAQTDLEWISTQLDQASQKPCKMSSELRGHVKQLPIEIQHFDSSSQTSVLRTRLKMCQIILEVATHLANSALIAPTTAVESAIQFMRDRLDEPTSILNVARAVGCSRARLFEIFKETTGLTPNDYWQRLRVEEAYRRVVNSSDSITKIAMDCGFTTSQYFCTVFRKYWGVSPRDCRKSNARPKDDSAVLPVA